MSAQEDFFFSSWATQTSAFSSLPTSNAYSSTPDPVWSAFTPSFSNVQISSHSNDSNITPDGFNSSFFSFANDKPISSNANSSTSISNSSTTEERLEPFQLDILTPLFDEETSKEDSKSLPAPVNEDIIKEEPPKVNKKQPTTAKKGKKRSKSKKNKIILSLDDFQCVAEVPDEVGDNASPVLWVGNIGPAIKESQLEDEFGIYGTVISCHILRDKYCAFITFDCASSAARAKKNLDRELIGDQYVVIHFRQPNGTLDNAVTNPPSNSLWIGNVSEDLTEQELLEEFQYFGQIESIRLLHNCAFVNYYSVDDAATALQYLQGKQLGKLNLRINFGKTKPTFGTPPGQPIMYPGYYTSNMWDPSSSLADSQRMLSQHNYS